jgi:hypothetical protein
MERTTKALRLLLAMMLAAPLGAGGLCCCLLGDACSVEPVTAAPVEAGAHGCCAGLPADAPAPGGAASGPTTDGSPDDGCCDCPEREAGLRPAGPVTFAVAGATSGASPVTVVAVLPVHDGPVAGDVDDADARSRFRSSLPPPGRSLHQVISVYLC